MNADKRIKIARWANANREIIPWEKYSLMKELFGSSDWKTVGSLALWAVGRDHGNLSEKSDEELKEMISLYFGFAADETIDPSRVIKSPDRLVVGKEYRLASNGYFIGKYIESIPGTCNSYCNDGCVHRDVAWVFEKDTRGDILWYLGIY
jgi:hypothetical protein